MDEGRIPLPGDHFYLLDHPQAPVFAFENRSNALLMVEQLISEVSGGNYPTSESFMQLLRQLGFVSLWFFLKFIAGSEGPYNELNDDLHREMCNFRQSDFCMSPGARAACLVPRGFFKSTIFTHGADLWEATRDPNITIIIANATASKAESFRTTIKETVEKNQLYRALYPECVPMKDAPRWNNSELVWPNRTRYQMDPTVNAVGAGASAEGLHGTLFNIDDLNGLDDLDSEHMGNLNMTAKKQWFSTNSRALLKSQKKSRIVYVATRFSMDDSSQIIVDDCRKFLGYVCDEFEEKANGTWVVYNRLGIEDGVAVNPDVITSETLSKQLDEDYWGAMTQSMNRPGKAGMMEFSEMRVGKASLIWSESEKQFYIIKGSDANFEDITARIPLSKCDLLMGIDPAGTDGRTTSKTSRTAIFITAMDSSGDVTILWRKVGYFDALKWFGFVFDGIKKFLGAVRGVIIEAAAMQKVLAPILQKEAIAQSTWAYFKPEPAPNADKAARIRFTVAPLLGRGKIYAVEGEDIELKQEIKVFPAVKSKMDALDALEKCIRNHSKPDTDEDAALRRWQDEELDPTRSYVTGY
jgi:hypothetical protein